MSDTFPAPGAELLDPRDDLVFKLLFGSNEDLLIALLSAVLEPVVPIQRAIVQNPELPQGFPADKRSILDIVVELDDGTRVDVEMQCAKHPTFRERALYYWAQLFSKQLDAGQEYRELKRVVSILVLDYREFGVGPFHEVFEIVGREAKQTFSSCFEMHTIELPKLPRSSVDSPLVRWARFLSTGDPGVRKRLAEEDPMIEKAGTKLLELSADQRLKHQLLERERHRVSHLMEVQWERKHGREEGRAEGREEGRAEGREEGIRIALREQLDRLLVRRELRGSEEARRRVDGCDDVPTLRRWLERAWDVETLDELLAETASVTER